MQRDRVARAVVFLIVMVGAPWMSAAAVPPPAAPKSAESPAFTEFKQRVQEYVQLQKTAPRLRTTKQRKEIVERRQALAQKIREVRSEAKPGDIFTPEVSEQFRQVIRKTFQGPNAANVRKTVRQGVPLASWHLSVNGDYPEPLPLTTVPPTLLRQLPQLPTGVAYRIVGHDFILADTEARLIVDFIRGALP